MSCQSRLKGVVALLLLFCGTAAQSVDTSNVLIVELYLNHQTMGDAFVLKGADGEYFVDESVLRHWQINRPWPEPQVFRGSNYYGIHQFRGALAELNVRTMKLFVSMPPALMPLRMVDMRDPGLASPIADFGAYMDYEVNFLSEDRTGSRTTFGLMSPVVFGPIGSLNASLLYRNHSVSDEFGADGSHNGLNVLELTYVRDDPSRLRSLRVGDIITQSGRMGRALRFGGIQLATNFSTQPTLITYPLPNFYGQAAVPTALDVYVNGRLTRREEVQPGPYILENVPVVNGAGQLQVVARDALGRQQVFTQDFYLSTELLMEGLSDYSFNIGALREAFGLENFRYGEMAASATWRHGLREYLTVEGHGEFADGLAMISGAGQYAIKAGGIASAGLGISTGESGTGARLQLGIQRMLGPFSYNVEVAGATRAFAIVGIYESAPKLQLLASGGVSTAELGSIGMAIVHQGFRDRPSRSIVSANHSMSFFNRLSLSTYLSYMNAEDSGFTAGVRFSMPLGYDHNLSGGIRAGRSGTRLDAGVRRNLPAGNGYGYHLDVSASDNSYIDAGLMGQTEVGTYFLDVRNSELGGNAWQVSSRGSIAYLDGMTNFTRQIRDAFAVVNVGNYEGVRVYAENQEIGRTNKNGQLFVPGLRPYLKNQLRIEVDDLPLNTNIDSLHKETAPFFRSGVVVNFGVRVAQDVILRVILPDGTPIPEGAVASMPDEGGDFPVGLDGLLYLQGIDSAMLIGIRWGGTTCDVDVPMTQGDAIIPNLGDIVCEPISVH